MRTTQPTDDGRATPKWLKLGEMPHPRPGAVSWARAICLSLNQVERPHDLVAACVTSTPRRSRARATPLAWPWYPVGTAVEGRTAW